MKQKVRKIGKGVDEMEDEITEGINHLVNLMMIAFEGNIVLLMRDCAWKAKT